MATKMDILKQVKAKAKVRELIFDDEIYLAEITEAIATVNDRRNFTPKDGKEFEDKYASLICKMAIYSLAKIGAEGQTAHQENGINRIYESAGDYPNALLSQIIPLIKS